MAEFKDETLNDLEELSYEDKEKLWQEQIKKQVDNLLDLFLSHSKDCNFNVIYKPVVIENLESGPVTDDSTASAVKLTMLFEFDKPVKLNKE